MAPDFFNTPLCNVIRLPQPGDQFGIDFEAEKGLRTHCCVFENLPERFVIAIFVEYRTAVISSIRSMVNGARFTSRLRSRHHSTLPPRNIAIKES